MPPIPRYHDIMRAFQCRRCENWWSGETGPEERFKFITRWCPYCLGQLFPVAKEHELVDSAGRPAHVKPKRAHHRPHYRKEAS